MKKQKKTKKIHFGWLFFLGLLLFALGIIGYTFRLFSWIPVPIREVLPQETQLLASINLESFNNEAFTLDKENFKANITQYLQEKLNLDFTTDIEPWIGKNISITVIQGRPILAIQYRSQYRTKKFLQKFITPTEKFIQTDFEDGFILTSEFSTPLSFGFYHNWLIISPDPTSLETIFTKKNSLKSNKAYRKIITDLPRKSLFFFFADTQNLAKVLPYPEKWRTYKPLILSLSQTFPSIGGTINIDDGAWLFSSKTLTDKRIFEDRIIPKVPNKNIPELAKITPKETLFFINGSDLYAKYLHTKNFLKEMDPQFETIFEGVLRAQFGHIFGKKFDFEADFLSQMRGQYAFILDIEDPLKPFLHLTFISRFDPQNKPSIAKFHKTIQDAQTQFFPEKRTIELPNGKTRQELVASKPENIPIDKVEFLGHPYFQIKEPDKNFAYTILDNQFILSSKPIGIESILSTIEKKNKNLAMDDDFRENVLFKFSASESYTFLNLEKLNPLLETWQIKDNGLLSSWFSQFRNITFSRKVFPGEIFIKAVLH